MDQQLKEKKLANLLQMLAEGYAKKSGKDLVNDAFSNHNVEKLNGVLYDTHVKILQVMLKEECDILGVDIVSEVNKSGETYQEGVFSTLEKKLINNKITNILLLLNEVEIKRNK